MAGLPYRRTLTAALLALAAGGCWDATRLVDPGDRREDPYAIYKDGIDFQQIVDHPTVYLREPVRFRCIFNQYCTDTMWLPFHTNFNPEHFIAFSVWPEHTRLWTKDGFVSHIDTLYINRASHGLSLDDYLDYKPFTVLEIEGIVINDFANMPWIEVQHVDTVRADAYTRDMILDLMNAFDLAGTNPDGAIAALENLKNRGGMPETADLDVYLFLGVLYKSKGDAVRASENLEEALRLDPENGTIKATLRELEVMRERRDTTSELQEPGEKKSSEAPKKEAEHATERRAQQERILLEAEVAKRDAQIKELQEKLGASEAKSGPTDPEMKKRLADLTQSQEKAAAAVAERDARLRDMEARLKTLQDERDDLARKTSGQPESAELKALRDRLASADADIARLQKARAEETQKKIPADLQEQLRIKDALIQELRKENEALTQERKDLIHDK